jgi:sugar lactone lactonase YvrE/tRNA A-37 threonylcarbamoyl transferase component Bud32
VKEIAVPTSTALAPGTRFARYTVESVVGRGAMSVVYAAHDRQLRRPVALKVLLAPAEDDPRFRERFLHESRLTASIDHPNVIPVYDAGEADGLLYIAMRLVHGTDLRVLLRREGPLELERALAIVAQAASALDAAHARGLLHRDVKPGNILLSSTQESIEHVYLSDFGLAVPGEGAAALERGFRGTAEYAAPEQIQGRAERRSDVYSLACVLFECLAGEPPFGRGRLLETLWRHLNEEPPSLSARCAAVPATADAVFAAALAADPERRPATCGDLVAAAREALAPAPPRRRVWPRYAAAIVLVGVAAAVVVAAAARRDSPPARGTIVTVAGTGDSGSTGDGGKAVRAQLAEPSSVTVDRRGDVYLFEDLTGRIRRIDRHGRISTIASVGDGTATPRYADLAIDGAQRLLILSSDYPALQRVGAGGRLTTIAGTGHPGYLSTGARTVSPGLCGEPRSVAVDRAGRVYIACSTANRVIRVDGRGTYTTVAGTGGAGYAGDGGPATKAMLNRPLAIAFDRRGDLYIADFLNNRLRKVSSHGIITTVAGNGERSLSGDGWHATSVALWQPSAVAADSRGDVYVAETATGRVRKIDARGVMTTVGDHVTFNAPSDLAVGPTGTLYIADAGNNELRAIVSP